MHPYIATLFLTVLIDGKRTWIFCQDSYTHIKPLRPNQLPITFLNNVQFTVRATANHPPSTPESQARMLLEKAAAASILRDRKHCTFSTSLSDDIHQKHQQHPVHFAGCFCSLAKSTLESKLWMTKDGSTWKLWEEKRCLIVLEENHTSWLKNHELKTVVLPGINFRGMSTMINKITVYFLHH